MNKLIRFAGFLPLLVYQMASRKNRMGGQAIIEGVMMRGKQKIAWAVRRPNGEMVVERQTFISITKTNKFCALPVIRGAVNLYESMKVGYKALTRSAEISMGEEPSNEKKSFKDSASLTLSMVVAIALSIGIFMYLPMFISQLFFPKTALTFNLVAGSIRIVLFLAYLIGISFWKDIQRVFQYHGAEHKAIFAFEDNKELTNENLRPYPTLHPRCGTSFLLLVALVCILLFSIIDSLIMHFTGLYSMFIMRFVVHITLIPLVGGLSYEVLKWSDKYQTVFPVSLLIKPGLWLQYITTKQPDDKQLETATAALKAAL
jgi:uncharacterized protein YqhQ